MSNKEKQRKGNHLVIILIIISSSWGVYNGINSLAEDKISDNWQTKDKHLLVEKCLKDAGTMATKYPELTEEYCLCSIKKVQERFSKKEYFQISNESMKIQKQELLPVIKSCQMQLHEMVEKVQKMECELTKIEGDSVYMVVDELPQYEGGFGALYKKLTELIRFEKTHDTFPPSEIKLSFIIDKNGHLVRFCSDAEVLDKDEIMKKLDHWIPGKLAGQKVNVKMILPMRITWG